MQNENIGRCVCTGCGFSMPALKGVDCSQLKCPKCSSPMRTGGAKIQPME